MTGREWKPLAGWLALGGALGTVVAALPLVSSDYVQDLAFTVLLFIVLTLGWNLQSGFTGYVNFGYAGFVGVGSYAGAIGIVRLGLPWLEAVGLAGLVTALGALIIGRVVLRLRGAYFALATLGLAATIKVFAASEYLSPLSGGGTGISISSTASLAAAYYALATLAVLALILTWAIARHSFGLRLLAIREDELAAQALGVRTTTCKVAAFVLSCLLAGLAGALLVMRLRYVDPNSGFDISYTLSPMVMAIVGGAGTVSGPVVGAATLTLIAEVVWARFLTAHFAIFGAVLVLAILVLPEGLIPLLQRRRWLPRVRAL